MTLRSVSLDGSSSPVLRGSRQDSVGKDDYPWSGDTGLPTKVQAPSFRGLSSLERLRRTESRSGVLGSTSQTVSDLDPIKCVVIRTIDDTDLV